MASPTTTAGSEAIRGKSTILYSVRAWVAFPLSSPYLTKAIPQNLECRLFLVASLLSLN